MVADEVEFVANAKSLEFNEPLKIDDNFLWGTNIPALIAS